jgi:hypothetical protein
MKGKLVRRPLRLVEDEARRRIGGNESILSVVILNLASLASLAHEVSRFQGLKLSQFFLCFSLDRKAPKDQD